MKIKNVTRLLKDGPRSSLTRVDVAEIQSEIEKEESRKLVPINTHILKRSSKYKKDMPKLLSGLASFRDKLLDSVYPKALSVMNGLADSDEVLTSALGPDASISSLQPVVESYMLEALKSRLIFLVLDCFELNPAEAQLYMLRVLNNEGFTHDRIQSLLHEMQSMVSLQRASKRPSLPVPELPASQRGRQRRGVQPDQPIPGPEGNGRARRRRVETAEDEEIFRKLRESRRPRQRRK